jgi:hypothetical protein
MAQNPYLKDTLSLQPAPKIVTPKQPALKKK